MQVMPCHCVLPAALPPLLPGVQAIHDLCVPSRERSWALRELSRMYREDAALLVSASERILCRTRMLRTSNAISREAAAR